MDGLGHIGERRQENHRGFRRQCAHSLHDAQAIAIRHPHVRHHQRARSQAETLQRLAGSPGGGHFPSLLAEIRLQRCAHGRFVVHNEDLIHPYHLSIG
jgi:hypothetical protein